MLVKEKIDFCSIGRDVIANEIQAIQGMLTRINASFQTACELLLTCQGKIAVLGMGKSGHIGRKIAATFASTGTPAFFVHPAEASHGDLGMIAPNDIGLLISNSGETPELLAILPLLKRQGILLLGLTGKPRSTLAQAVDCNLNIAVAQEADLLGLAPTTSTTVTLVMGDALAISLLQARGFTIDQFARFHPGGALGKRLLLHVKDLMHTGTRVPCVTSNTLLDQALLEMTQKSFGMTAVVDEQRCLLGVFSDGDLRRTLDAGHDIHTTRINAVMTHRGLTVYPNTIAASALKTMEDRKITALIVIDDQNHPIGILHMYDLLRAGIV